MGRNHTKFSTPKTGNRYAAIELLVLFACVYSVLGALASCDAIAQLNNLWFGADNARAYRDSVLVDANHYRIKVHPLYLVMVQPVVSLFGGMMPSPMLALVFVQSVAGAGMVALLYMTLKELEASEGLSVALSVLFGFSFSQVVFSTVPETFVFSGLVLVGWWWWLTRASKGSGRLSTWEAAACVFFGVASFGVTLTNIVSFLVGFAYLLSRRRSGASAVAAMLSAMAVAVIALAGLQSALWPQCPTFWGSVASAASGAEEYEEFRYTSTGFSPEKLSAWFKSVFLRPLVAPDVLPVHSSQLLLVFGPYGAVAKLVVAVMLAAGFAAVLVYCFRAAVRKARFVPELAFIGAAFAFNAALHFFYGYTEAFIYSPHFLFLGFLLVGIALSALPRGKLAGAAAGAVAVAAAFAAMYNVDAFVGAASRVLAESQALLGPGRALSFGVASACLVAFASFCSVRIASAVPRVKGMRVLLGAYVLVVAAFCVFLAVLNLGA